MHVLIWLMASLLASCSIFFPVASSPQEGEGMATLSQQLGREEEVVNTAIAAAKESQKLRLLLAQKFMEQRLYGRASTLLEHSLADEPQNGQLFYLAGLSNAYVAKSQPEAAIREEYLGRAEFYYRRAVDIEPRNVSYVYALSVFLIYERSDAQGSLPFIEELREINSKDVNYAFLQGHAYVLLGKKELAVAAYRDVTENDRATSAQKDTARALIAELGGGGG